MKSLRAVSQIIILTMREVDSTHGKIGDVDVVWNITPNDDNAYQNNLDATLVKQNDASADDKIDLFLIEADYALKYVDSDYTVPIKDLGIADSDTSKQYQYTKDVVTDSDGVLKGLSWQGCPGSTFLQQRGSQKRFLERMILKRFRSQYPTGIHLMLQQKR